MLFQRTRARSADPMTSEESHRVPLSTEVSPPGTEIDPQLSACAQDGPLPKGHSKTPDPERRRRASPGAQAVVSFNTVRIVAS
jgi:hypothetical protein